MNKTRIALLLVAVAGSVARADFPVELIQQQKIQAYLGVSELEGLRLAIDGNTFVQSDASSNLNAKVYVRANTNWMLQATLESDDPESGEEYGFAESVAVDGETIAVGAPLVFSPLNPAAYVFVRNGTNWTRQAKLESTDEFFGSEVDIDGDTLAVGAAAAGTTTMFVRSGTNWFQQARLVTGARDKEGAVALDGDTVVIGSWNRNVFGAAYVYVRVGTNWTQQALLTATDTGTPNMSRRHVAISGDTIAVGDLHGSVGRVYVFQRFGANWVLQAKLTVTNSATASLFGRYVALAGDILVANADADNASGSFAGAVFLFERTGTNWTQRAKLTANDAAANRQFGKYIALSGTTIAAANAQTGVYLFTPDYSNAPAVAGFVRKFLYHADAAAPGFSPSEAAFRYRQLLYGRDTNNLVRARFELMAALYGAAERERSFDAQDELLKGLAVNPASPLLGNLLLDIYYDRAGAQAIFARDLVAKAESARFGPPIAPNPPASGFLIDNEIPIYEQALATNRFALQEFFDVLQLGLVTDSGTDAQFGYELFRDLSPTRGQMPATFLETNGVPQSVLTNSAPLFNGYKDVALLFDLLRDRGRLAASVGELRFARGGVNDLAAAKDVVNQAQQFLYLQGTLLQGIFPNLPPPGDASGIAEAIAGWSASMTTLTELQQKLSGRVNPLGFDADFLMLAQRISTPSSNYFDSFDSFAYQLNPAAPTSALKTALDKFNQALASYATYRGYQDQLREQIDQSIVSYEFRLQQIVGVAPGDPGYSDNPANNPGSELDQQFRSIELAKLRIQRNQTEVSNLYEQVNIEISRAGAVSNVFIKFGDKRAALAEKLAHINAVQSGANALAESLTVEKLTTGLFAGFLVNAIVQAGAEELKGQVEAEKERQAGLEQASIEGINSGAAVKTLLLQMNTLVLDSQEAAILLGQELARLTALYREKQQLEARILERNSDLASRYYADPIHRITAETNLITANLAFDEAQKWLFFLTRAYFYKWNATFTNNYLGKIWNASSVFKVRNADELHDLYLALVNKNDTVGLGLSRDDAQTTFSVRKDFFGFEDGFTYADPVTLETISPVEAFRRKLKGMVVTNLSDVRLEVGFSTVREKESTSFFLGPRFNLAGTAISPGRYLDKIVWLKIKIPGSHTVPFTQANGDLTYGGTSDIRRQNPGQLVAGRPDRIRNEMTAFSTRFWFFDTFLDRFRFNEGFISSGVQIELSPDPDIDPSVAQINDFVERSVAASNWHLSIPIHNLNSHNDLLRISDIDDILIFFKHESVSRQPPP